MRKIITLLLMFFIFGNLFSQTERLYRDIINSELKFLTPIDSFKNIYPINNGMTVINKETINLKSIYMRYYSNLSDFYKDNVKKYYLYTGKQNDSLTVVLYFCYDKLFQVSFFVKGGFYLNNIKYECERIFGTKNDKSYSLISNSTVYYADRRVTYGERCTEMQWYGSYKKVDFLYEENFITSEGYLTISDKKIMDLMPSWCGICNDGRTWDKLKLYLNKHGVRSF